MNNSILNRRNRRDFTIISLSGLTAGLVYPIFADGFSEWLPFFNGGIIGLSMAIVVGLSEIYLFRNTRKWRFSVLVLLKSLFYFLIAITMIVLFIAFNESVYLGISFSEHIKGERFQNFLFEGDFIVIVFYSLIIISSIIFVIQINRKMGQGILLNFITGRYHAPREEEKIFMFLDLKSSTSIGEKLEGLTYYELLNDFFHDITKCILYSKGVIYRYVGDEIVVTWSMSSGLDKANCIRAYFYIKNEIDSLKEKYLASYGHIPGFRAAFHCGEVVSGEIGEVKSQIVLHGDTMYTTAQIEKQCGQTGNDILVSSVLMDKLSLPVIYKSAHVGSLPGQEIELYTIMEEELASY